MNENEPLLVLTKLAALVTVVGVLWGIAGPTVKNFVDRIIERHQHQHGR